MRKYDAIFSPEKIGKLTIKNRIVMPPMGTTLASMSGELSADNIAYYKERAKGGVGLIIIECCEVNHGNGKTTPTGVRMDTIRGVPKLQRLTEAVHVYGTKIFCQLYHGGNQCNSLTNDGNEPVSSSDVQSTYSPDRPRALSNKEVKEYIQNYIFSAAMAQRAQFDGVEIHAAHGCLPVQFMNTYTNRRSDEYGGSFENRMRFTTEIIQGIKAACGADFPVSVRLSIDMLTPPGMGYGLEEGLEIVKALEAAGADVINCSSGAVDGFPNCCEPAGFAQGWRVYMAEEVKKVVDIPVITVGALREPEFVEKILQDKRADFVAIGRGLIADPEWCNKARQGREKEIRKCISCNNCINVVSYSYPLSCSINARAGHEAEYPAPRKDGNGRKVVVVGGGPAGLEAARVCAIRGFNVVLFEKEAALGGQLQFANNALHQDRMNWFIEYMAHELNRLGVEIRMNCNASADSIRKENPFAVFIASGGTPIVPNVPGSDKPLVITAEDYLSGKVKLSKEKVVVIGGGITGCETSALVGANGGDATVIEMAGDICQGLYMDSRKEILSDLEKYGVSVMTNCLLAEVKSDSIIIKDLVKGNVKEIPVDKVVMAAGVKPVNGLFDELADEVEYIYTLGDAIQQGKIIDAVRTAHVRALDLE